ncbi:hypothetical protein PQG46_04545 [Aquirufa nivalisilvae]
MKIVICFSPEKIPSLNLGKDDIVLINGKFKAANFKVIDICQASINYNEYKKEFDLALEAFYVNSKLNDKAKALIASISPSLYLHNLRFCIFWIQSFKNVLNENCGEIILTDFLDDLNYFPFYEAEGETNRKLFYKNYDFISSQIMKYAHEYCLCNTKCKLTILTKHSKLKARIRFFLRRYFLFCAKVLFHTLKILVTPKLKIEKKINVNCIISSRSIAHSHGMEKLFRKAENSIIHISEGLTFSNKNHAFLKRKFTNIYSQYQSLSLLDLIKSIYVCFEILKYRNALKSIDVCGVKLHLRSVFIEGTIVRLESELYARSLYNLANYFRNISTIIIPEIISQYSAWVKNKFINKKIKIVQLQTVGLDILPLPNFIFTDLFLFDSAKVFEYFKQIFPDQTNKLAYWGNISFDNNKIKKKKILKSIVFFTQPYEIEEQENIICYLAKVTKERNINFYIKPHPRENLNLMPGIAKDVFLLPKNFAKEDYLSYCDLAILRTSSITQDLILEGIPVLNLLISSFDKSVKLDYLNLENTNVFTNLNAITSIIDSFEAFLSNYYNFRTEYILKQGFDKGVNDFVDSLDDYTRINN